MSSTAALPLALLLSSLIPGLLIFFLHEEQVRVRTALNLAGALAKLVIIGLMIQGVLAGEIYRVRYQLLPGIEIVLHADALSMLFATLSTVLWLLTTVYAIGYLEASPHRSRFFGFFSLCVSATIGIALAGNLVTFLIFYELLTLTTYPLVIHTGTPQAQAAGRTYLAYTLTGGLLLLLGTAWLAHLLGNGVDFRGGSGVAGLPPSSYGVLQLIFALLVTGLGVKAALVPLHAWLPQAMVAPAPVSALLHAVAVVKAGAFGIVRVVYDVFGVGFAQELGVLMPLAVVAAVTIVYGSYKAISQEELKPRLAYSTVSQVAYIVLGTAIFGYVSTIGALVHLVHQGLMKITLFFCAGNLQHVLGVTRIRDLDGAGRRMPWTMAAFTVGALGMIGLPPIAGFVSKWYLGVGSLQAGQGWALYVLAISSMLNGAYFLPILYRAWFRPPARELHCPARPHSHPGADWMLLLPPIVTAAFSVLAGLFAASPASPLSWSILVAANTWRRFVPLWRPSEPEAVWLLLIPTLPLLVALGWPLRHWRPRVMGGIRLIAVFALGVAVLAPADLRLQLNWVLLDMQLALGPLEQLFLAQAALVWLVGSLIPERRASHAAQPLYFLLAMAGHFGLIIAQDMISFYMFFALMSFASYGLIANPRRQHTVTIANIFLLTTLAGEILLFMAMNVAAAQTGSVDLGTLTPAPTHALSILFVYLAFAVKAGGLPVHFTLPMVYNIAAPGAGIVFAGAMLNAGILGWLRFLPLTATKFPQWGEAFILLGLAAAFLGVIIGLAQSRPRALLAYSSISQIGLMLAGIGVGIAQFSLYPLAVSTVTFFAVQQALAKGALFYGSYLAGWSHGASAGRRFLLMAGLAVPALILAGAPLTSGYYAKHALKELGAALPPGSLAGLFDLLPLSSLATALLMLRFLYLCQPRSTGQSRLGRMHLGLWLCLLGACLLAPLHPAFRPFVAIPAVDATSTGAILLALLLAGGRRWLPVRVRRWRVLPGDWVVYLRYGYMRLKRTFLHHQLRPRRIWRGRRFGRHESAAAMRRPDHWLAGWPQATGLFAVLILLAWWLL